MTGTGGIRAVDLDVEIDGARILTGVTAHLPHRRIAVIGANGSGKSTFARTLNGLVRPSGGTLEVDGVDAIRDAAAVRRRVGFLFTNPDAQILMPTPAEDLALSLKAQGVPKGERGERAREHLGRFGLAERADQPAHSLSGGQKQLLALAAVLATRPRILVADEPTTLLDLGNARRMGDLLIDGDEHGAVADQVVVVTHDLELATRCDVALRFADGRLVEEGDPVAVVSAYREAFA